MQTKRFKCHVSSFKKSRRAGVRPRQDVAAKEKATPTSETNETDQGFGTKALRRDGA
jgi:hypothetical protein